MTSATTTTVVDLLRHGEVKGGRCYRGQQDDPLTEQGWQQMHGITARSPGWQQVISSPLQRCARFATQMASHHALPLQTDVAFQEIAFGQWEGKTAEQLLQTDAERIQQYWNDPLQVTPPGGESLPDFQQRVLRGWQQLLQQHQGKHVLLLTHAGVIRIIVAHVLGMPLDRLFNLQVELASASRIRTDHDAGQYWSQLVFHGSDFA